MTAVFAKGVQIPLPCGCVLGTLTLCAQARLLWDVAAQAMLEARAAETQAKWLIYQSANRAYEGHFVIPKS